MRCVRDRWKGQHVVAVLVLVVVVLAVIASVAAAIVAVAVVVVVVIVVVMAVIVIVVVIVYLHKEHSLRWAHIVVDNTVGSHHSSTPLQTRIIAMDQHTFVGKQTSSDV